MFLMAQLKPIQLESVQLENVSLQVEGLDPVLTSVDLDVPMDKTVVVKATNPMHAVHLLEILAGRREPQKGKVKWQNSVDSSNELPSECFFGILSSYFESERPFPETEISKIFAATGASQQVIDSAVEHFCLQEKLNFAFKKLSYEQQKLIMLAVATLRMPQMLVLEDPAVGLSEECFLDFLDWIQLWQRQGHLRHIFLTNNHPTAARHLDAISMFVDEGLVYVEDTPLFKKVVQF